MSMALTVAIYFLICRELDQPPMFPGNKFFYNAVDDASYAPSIADMSVWASTHEHTKNHAFNHNNGDYIVWKYFWARLGEHFAMEVGQPPNGWWNSVTWITKIRSDPARPRLSVDSKRRKQEDGKPDQYG